HCLLIDLSLSFFCFFPFFFYCYPHPRHLHSFPTRRSSDLSASSSRSSGSSSAMMARGLGSTSLRPLGLRPLCSHAAGAVASWRRSEEHTSELQSLRHLVCRLLLEKKKKKEVTHYV